MNSARFRTAMFRIAKEWSVADVTRSAISNELLLNVAVAIEHANERVMIIHHHGAWERIRFPGVTYVDGTPMRSGHPSPLSVLEREARGIVCEATDGTIAKEYLPDVYENGQRHRHWIDVIPHPSTQADVGLLATTYELLLKARVPGARISIPWLSFRGDPGPMLRPLPQPVAGLVEIEHRNAYKPCPALAAELPR